MSWTKRILSVMGAIAALLVAADVAVAQCAMCRTALVNSPEGQKLANGFNSAILFLLGAPFVVAGTIAFLIFRPYLRRALLAGRGTSIARGQESAAALGRSP